MSIIPSTFFNSRLVRRRYRPARNSATVCRHPSFLTKLFCASTLSVARRAVMTMAWAERRTFSRLRKPVLRVCHKASNSISQAGCSKTSVSGRLEMIGVAYDLRRGTPGRMTARITRLSTRFRAVRSRHGR